MNSLLKMLTKLANFLGYKIYPTHHLVRKENVKRFVKRMKRYYQTYLGGEISLGKVAMSIQSWVAHAAHADSYHLRQKLGVSQETRRFLVQYSSRFAGGEPDLPRTR